jgi:uncharacterized protein
MIRSIALAFSLFTLTAVAQELPRRAFFGISMERITEDTKRVMSLPSTKGALINRVIPGSTAEKAKLQVGDVLLSVNGKEVNSPDEGVKIVSSYKGGEPFNYTLIRKGKEIKGKSEFKAMAEEKYPGIEMQYTATQTVNGLQRLIVSKPINKDKSPAIIFIGGIGCYSLDFPFDSTQNEVQLLNTLTRAGYVCVRAEKPGVGDNSKCTPCSEVTFNNEKEGYVSAVNSIKKYTYVDSNQVYIIGHSMGGVMAPLIAAETKVAGIIAYGTIGSSFIEYLAKTRRTIGEAYQWSADETDEYIKESCECAGYYFVERLTTEQATAKNKICGEYLPVFDYRSRKYNDELYALNIPGAWKKFEGRALLLWGAADYIASKEDHQIITSAVNEKHPGKATFEVVENSTHGFQTAKDFPEARTNPGSYNGNAAKSILNWLKQS